MVWQVARLCNADDFQVRDLLLESQGVSLVAVHPVVVADDCQEGVPDPAVFPAVFLEIIIETTQVVGVCPPRVWA